MTAAILVMRGVVRPVTAVPNNATATRIRPVAPFQPTNRRRRLVCRWHREAGGRLACTWEPEIGPTPARLIAIVAKLARHFRAAA